MGWMDEDFLLQGQTARRLYHSYAEPEPILDYHCHLPPKDIAENRQFKDLYEIALEGDHYKWRAMRANGIDERFCTGHASPHEKWTAFAKTVPHTLRNPLYHWTHLELRRYFGIDTLLNESTAEEIWNRANELLAKPELSAHGILSKFKVRALCTTDDPADSLVHHKQIAASGLATRVFPTFRPDKAMNVHRPDLFNDWITKLEKKANVSITRFRDLLDAIEKRHDKFHEMGGRLSDHGLDHAFAAFCTEPVAAHIFDRARAGFVASPEEHAQFATFLMMFFGHLDSEKGWTKQLHLGAKRSANSRMFRRVGPDTGFDSIGDWPQVDDLGAYLDKLDEEHSLPRTIVYNLNPADNYAIATLCGDFQDGTIAGKVQFGSGWWFLDQKEAMEWQMNALSNTGLLSRFVGMLTDSRSFMSYPRHEYFRRTLCNLIGGDVDKGLLPDDDAMLGPLVANICYRNAYDYLGLPME